MTVIRTPQYLPPPATKVFISYSWDDKAVVTEVKKYLKDAGFQVIIDEDDMQAAQSILDFIQNSIKNCDAVLSIVSSKSLQSGWAGQESIAALYAIWLADKAFIPVRLDDVSFDVKFQIAIQRGIQSKIQELEDGIAELKSIPGADTRAFDEDKNKLFDMQTNMGKIMQRLKSVLTLDISGDNFLTNMKKVEDRIRSIKP
jgi:TIR domain